MVDDAELLARAEALVAAYAADGRTVATAESCTGGLVAGLLTAVPGSSAVVERGFVTYSNEAKAEAIGVPMDLIRRHGAVSEAVAGALERHTPEAEHPALRAEIGRHEAKVQAALSPAEIEEKFDLGYHTKHVDTIFRRVFGEA